MTAYSANHTTPPAALVALVRSMSPLARVGGARAGSVGGVRGGASGACVARETCGTCATRRTEVAGGTPRPAPGLLVKCRVLAVPVKCGDIRDVCLVNIEKLKEKTYNICELYTSEIHQVNQYFSILFFRCFQ